MYNECERVIVKNSKVLEIGCGNGRNLFEFEKLKSKVYGIDLSEYAINLANYYKAKFDSSASFYLGDLKVNNFKKKQFDTILLLSNTITEMSYEYFRNLCNHIKQIITLTGTFCLEVKDSIIHFSGTDLTKKNYCANDSKLTDLITIDNNRKYIYCTYIWTLGMIKFILSLHFKEIQVKDINHNRYWIECRGVIE